MQTALDRLNALGKPRGKYPPMRPKDSASLVILDRSGPAPKVLLGRRHDGHVFMPGKFVFPGGRVESVDARMPARSELHPAAVEKLGGARKARALALAAVRETFEETGLMLGAKGEAPQAPGGLWRAFAQAGILPDLAPLHYIARAVTPPGLPRRFDTRFFVVDAQAIAHRVDGVVGPQAELVELVWTSIADTARLDLMVITSAILEELERRLRAGMGRGLPVPFYRMVKGRFVRELL